MVSYKKLESPEVGREVRMILEWFGRYGFELYICRFKTFFNLLELAKKRDDKRK